MFVVECTLQLTFFSVRIHFQQYIEEQGRLIQLLTSSTNTDTYSVDINPIQISNQYPFSLGLGIGLVGLFFMFHLEIQSNIRPISILSMPSLLNSSDIQTQYTTLAWLLVFLLKNTWHKGPVQVVPSTYPATSGVGFSPPPQPQTGLVDG